MQGTMQAANSWRCAAVNVSFPDCFTSAAHNVTNLQTIGKCDE